MKENKISRYKSVFLLALTIVICLVFFISPGFSAADALRITSYNILHFPDNSYLERLPYFRTVIHQIEPDILVVQEIKSQDGVDIFLNNVMNYYQADKYAAAPFVDGPGDDNCLFYNQELFTFVSNRQIATDIRDISEYVLYYSHIIEATEFRVYSLDFKAGNDSYSENKRFAESTTLRGELNELATGTHFFVCGTFNFYSTSEQGFEMITGILSDNDGRSFDPINQVGNWYENQNFADIHSQSTRIAEFGGGDINGLRKRSDLIFISTAVVDGIVYEYVATTYTTFGNDGLHYMLDVNNGTNQSVSADVADALYYASDHLPVYLDFTVTGTPTPVELTNF
ncbi:endonuclease/exonuclease/phosphatase family protein [candidate division KSB1 bacterium]|nr:endonuclease/exonuclease/phosphatase family protein [candidate division KSB1 bacterium]